MNWPIPKQKRLLPFKCSRCGKERKLYCIDGVPISDDLICHKCGAGLLKVNGKYGTVRGIKAEG